MKKLISIFLIFFILLIYKNNIFPSNICIQIVAFPAKEKTSFFIHEKKVTNFIIERKDCIIDKRKGGKYYGVCCGNFQTLYQAKKELKKIKKIFKHAFYRKFNPNSSENALKYVKYINPPKIKPVKVPKLKKVKKLSQNIASKSNFEEKELSTFISRNFLNATENANYEAFSLKSYLETLTSKDIDYKLSKISSQILQIDSQLERDRYNPDIYFSIDATSRKSYNVGSATSKASADILAAIHFDWHIYDAQKRYYLNERRVIFNELTKLNLLSAKDRLMINGVYIYMSLWYLQKIVDDYNFLIEQQEKLLKMVQMRKLKGVNINFYEPIDSQNDFYNLELQISDIKESYIQQELLFRESIELTSNKPLYLFDPIYNDLNLSLKELQKEAIAKNRELAKLQARYKLSKSDILLAAAKKGWSIDFYSYGGYGGSTELEGSNTDSGNGFEWGVGVRARYPLFNRNDLKLTLQRKKLEAAQAALNVAKKIKTLTTSITKLYNSIKKLKYKEEIYKSQNKLLKKRLIASYKRYVSGQGRYKEYSDTLRMYIENLRGKLLNESLLHSSILQMYILIGRNLYQ